MLNVLHNLFCNIFRIRVEVVSTFDMNIENIKCLSSGISELSICFWLKLLLLLLLLSLISLISLMLMLIIIIIKLCVYVFYFSFLSVYGHYTVYSKRIN